MSSSRRSRSDVIRFIQGRAPLGESDSRGSCEPKDAAMADRSGLRKVSERSPVVAGGARHAGGVGRTRSTRRRRQGCANPAPVRGRLEHRQAGCRGRDIQRISNSSLGRRALSIHRCTHRLHARYLGSGCRNSPRQSNRAASRHCICPGTRETQGHASRRVPGRCFDGEAARAAQEPSARSICRWGGRRCCGLCSPAKPG
jgi:hypothetical protein